MLQVKGEMLIDHIYRLFLQLLSIDGLSVGYLRNKGIKIPWFSQLIIVLTTSAAFMSAMSFGSVFMSFFPPTTAKFIGAILL